MGSALSVSVVMPVYNSEAYVAGAAASVLRERTPGMELLLVDDGSADGSGAVCDRLAARDPRVRVIHEENGGMCHARNVGIREARGEYVAFADNDDEVLPGFVDDNLAVARRHGADVVRFGRRLERIDARGRVVRTSDAVPARECFLTGDELREDLPAAYEGSDAVWASLYRRDFLLGSGIGFPESFRSGMEDVWFNDRVIQLAGSVAYNPRCYYIWKRRSSHSTSMRPSDNRMRSIGRVLELEHSMMESFGTLESRPRWCSSRLFKQVRDQLTMWSYSEASDREAEMATFAGIRRLLEPYLGFMTSHSPGGVDGLMLRLLAAERYWLLGMVVRAGVAIRGLCRCGRVRSTGRKGTASISGRVESAEEV